jgi:hypothetical protein
MDSNNSAKSSLGTVRSSLPLPPKTLIGFLLAVAAVAIIALLSYQSLQATTATAANLTQTIEVLGRLESLLSTVIDAETGQRGFLLTGEESYLAPYTDAKDALPEEIKSMRALLVNRPEQRRRLDALESLANLKMAELDSTITLRRASLTQLWPSCAPTAARSTWIGSVPRQARWRRPSGSCSRSTPKNRARPRPCRWR